MAGESIESGEAPLSRDRMIAQDRAAFLASDEAEEAVDSKPSPDTTAADDEDEAEKPAVAADEDDASEDDEPAVDEDDDEDDVDEELDAPAAKAMAQVRKAEKRLRERMASERQSFERERQQWQEENRPRLEAAQTLERLKQRVKYEPDAVLAELGLADDDWELASRRAFARTKAAAQDPKWRDAADRMAKEREAADRLAAIERDNAALRSELKQAEAAKAAEREGKAYLQTIVKAADDNAPLLRRQLEKNPTKAENTLAAIAVELFDKKGVQPSPAKVIAVYEKRRRAELEELGVDVNAIAKAKPALAGKKAAPAAAPAKPAAVPAAAAKRDLRSSILAELEAGQYE